MRTVAIVQARMGSTRLPGKVMMDIEGWPMLGRVVSRLQMADKVDHVVVATTQEKEDDCIETFMEEHFGACFRPDRDPDDVLGRYFDTAWSMEADIIVRVTADCPLIDPDVVDRVVKLHSKTMRLDPMMYTYVSNLYLSRTYPRGVDVEVFDFKFLAKANRDATEEYQRVHVTPYMIEYRDALKANLPAPEPHPELRLCVDEEEDLMLVRQVFKHFGNNLFSVWNVINYLKENPEVAAINEGVYQKEWKEL